MRQLWGHPHVLRRLRLVLLWCVRPVARGPLLGLWVRVLFSKARQPKSLRARHRAPLLTPAAHRPSSAVSRLHQSVQRRVAQPSLQGTHGQVRRVVPRAQGQAVDEPNLFFGSITLVRAASLSSSGARRLHNYCTHSTRHAYGETTTREAVMSIMGVSEQS